VNVLSLFDGISCGQIALNRAGVEYEKYYDSEIDKFAIKVTQKNYPETIQIGDIRGVKTAELENINLIIGGSPCQGFSTAGQNLNFSDERSGLFFEFLRILREIKPKYFLFENVVMKKEYKDFISRKLGVKPVLIESSVLSAANRKRLYWTNIPIYGKPEDKNIHFGDIREHDVENKYYYSEKALKWFRTTENRTGRKMKLIKDGDKMQTLEASMFRKYSVQRFFGIEDTKGIRYVTPTECERCMTVPDGYTSSVSDTQRYKQLGNGWTVDVIAWILGFIEQERGK